MSKKEILGYEYKHSYTVPHYDNYEDDLTVIKEIIHYKDGSKEPRLRMIKNFQKPFWIVKERHRTYNDKRVWVEEEICDKYETNTRNYNNMIGQKLRFQKGTAPRILNRSPYLAGNGIDIGSLLNYRYRQRFPDCSSSNTIVFLDVETDVNGTDKMQMISFVYKNKVYQVLTKEYVGTEPDFVKKVKEYFDSDVLEIIHKVQREKLKHELMWDFELEIEIVENEWDLVTWIFERLHKCKPEIVTAWNIAYDLDRIVLALERGGIHPKDVFSDPGVPYEFRYFQWNDGKPRNGEHKDVDERWPRVVCPAHFVFIDQMCAFRRLRLHLPKEPSMKLEDIAIKLFGITKLKNDVNERSTGVNWHSSMQRFHKVFYAVYNIMDNVILKLIDEHTRDLKMTIQGNKIYTEYNNFGSQGRRIADDFFFFLMEKGKVMTAASDEMVKEIEKRFTMLDGWISTLPSHSVDMEMGAKILQEWEDFTTMVVKWVLDIDVKSSYPSTGYWANIARETTRYILTKIKGVSDDDIRRCGIHMSSGKVNAIDIICTLTKAPRSIQLSQIYDKKMKIKNGQVTI